MISTDPFCCIGAAFLLLVLPLEWVLSAITAALIHELSHILAVLLLGGRILQIRVSVMGCEIETAPMDSLRSALCIMAGPMGSFLLLLLRRNVPQIAVCGLLQGAYNLLPVLPLDGGRILYCVLCACCQNAAQKIMRWCRYMVCGGIFLVTAAAFLQSRDLFPLIGGLIFNAALLRRKIPCKENRIGLQ